MSEYDPHAVRAAAQAALDEVIEREGCESEMHGEFPMISVDLSATIIGYDIIEAAMIAVLKAHGITKRKPV